MVPLAVIAAVVLVFIKENPLATAIEHDVLNRSISEVLRDGIPGEVGELRRSAGGG
jgi:hypothetical protein